MTAAVIDLDDTDRSILRALALDAGVSAGELGRRFGLSQPAAWRRVKRLEEKEAAVNGDPLPADPIDTADRVDGQALPTFRPEYFSKAVDEPHFPSDCAKHVGDG